MGVCGSCLKDKLTLLTSTYVGASDSPESSPADVRHFASTIPSLHVEKGEGEEPQPFTNQEIDEGITISHEAINAEKPSKQQLEISNEGISSNEEINAGGSAVNRCTQWRSKSLCERREHFRDGLSAIKEGQAYAIKKVTLRYLFAIDDEEQLKNHKEEAISNNNVAHGERGAVGYNNIDESRRPVSKQLIEQKNNTPTHYSYGCVSSTSSSACPVLPQRIRHSLWFNSLLCRKRTERRGVKAGSNSPAGIKTTSQVAAGEVTSVFPGEIRGNAGGIRAANANGIRGHERRRRSKEINLASPTPHWATEGLSLVDSRSERKFNLAARALAFDFPSILPSEEPQAVIPSTSQTCNDDHTGATEKEFRPAAQGMPNLRPTAQEQAAVTTTEFLPTAHFVASNVSYWRSLSCNSTSIPANHGRHHQQKLPEYRMSEPYYSPGRINKAKLTTTFGRSAIPPDGRSGADATRYFSRTVKISPATLEQSGLLRFYLTPLRSSGRTRISSGRRPCKRGFWSVFFLPK